MGATGADETDAETPEVEFRHGTVVEVERVV